MTRTPTINRRGWLALWAQKRRRTRVRAALATLLPAPVLRAQYPDKLVWAWELPNPLKWNVWMSFDSGATWTLAEGYWMYGDARQFAPDGGSELYFIVGVDEAGNEVTRRSNWIRPEDALLPAPVLAAQYPDKLVWDWDLVNPFKWDVWQSLDNGASYILVDGYWMYGDARQFAPDGGGELPFIVGVDEAGYEITERSNAVHPDDAAAPLSPLVGLAAYWDGDSYLDGFGLAEILTSGDGLFGSSQLLPSGSTGLVMEALTETDLFYSKSAVFDNYSARTLNCWVNLQNWHGNFLLADVSDDGLGAGTGLSLRFCADGGFYEFNSHYDGGWDSSSAPLLEGQVLPATWFMLTITSDDSEMRIYINGALSGTLALTGATTPYYEQGAESFWLNGPHFWGNMIGQFCYLGVWGRVLDPTELETLYNNGAGLAFAGL